MNKKTNNKMHANKGLLRTISKAILYVDANTASCALMHQPKAPVELSKYKLINKD